MKTYKAIIQLTSDDIDVHRSMIRQIGNLRAHLAHAVDVRIVCHGASLPFCIATGNAFTDEILALLNQHVTIAACRNMLASNGVSSDELIEGIEIIPSGIAELVVLQQEGWSYVKAG
jgi:uncharacterized protein